MYKIASRSAEDLCIKIKQRDYYGQGGGKQAIGEDGQNVERRTWVSALAVTSAWRTTSRFCQDTWTVRVAFHELKEGLAVMTHTAQHE